MSVWHDSVWCYREVGMETFTLNKPHFSRSMKWNLLPLFKTGSGQVSLLFYYT